MAIARIIRGWGRTGQLTLSGLIVTISPSCTLAHFDRERRDIGDSGRFSLPLHGQGALSFFVSRFSRQEWRGKTYDAKENADGAGSLQHRLILQKLED